MIAIPSRPQLPESQHAAADVWLRYEDVSQDGRLTMHGMPHALGEVFWRKAAPRSGIDEELRSRGVVPILTRLCTEGGQGPLSITAPLRAEGCYQLASVVDDDERVTRILLRVWVELTGPRGCTHGPQPPGSGELIFAGRLYAEHVFTRLFAPRGERSVTRLEAPGLEAVPRARWQWRDAQALAELPEGARPLDSAMRLDAAAVAIGLDDTDSNQHVNSLVYPRLFREATLRSLAEHGHDSALLASYQETAFRKPCFAGDRMRVAFRCFELGERLGAAVSLLPDVTPLATTPEELASEPAHCNGLVLLGR